MKLLSSILLKLIYVTIYNLIYFKIIINLFLILFASLHILNCFTVILAQLLYKYIKIILFTYILIYINCK